MRKKNSLRINTESEKKLKKKVSPIDTLSRKKKRITQTSYAVIHSYGELNDREIHTSLVVKSRKKSGRATEATRRHDLHNTRTTMQRRDPMHRHFVSCSRKKKPTAVPLYDSMVDSAEYKR